jgi:hypothetical protein
MKTFICSFWVIKSRRVSWAGHVACTGEMKNAYNILIGKSEGKRPLERPIHIWENNIRMDLKEIGWEVVDWMHWLRTGTSDGLLRIWYWTFGYHKMWGIS